MKRSHILGILTCLFLASVVAFFLPRPVAALEYSAPVETSPGQIAMIYHRLTGQAPDFAAWAAASDSYLKAGRLDKLTVQQQKAAELQNIFDLISLQDPIVIRVPVKLSAYSHSNYGYFIENFREDTFFSFGFMGQNYAVIPQNLVDRQWIPVSGEAAMKIEKALGAARQLTVYLRVLPKFADKSVPMKLDGIDHWLLMGEPESLSLYSYGGDYLLWESAVAAPSVDAPDQSILDLKR